MVHFTQTEFPVLIFTSIATEKLRAAVENISIKVSALLPS